MCKSGVGGWEHPPRRESGWRPPPHQVLPSTHTLLVGPPPLHTDDRSTFIPQSSDVTLWVSAVIFKPSLFDQVYYVQRGGQLSFICAYAYIYISSRLLQT
jgi:hypothetical protein